MPIVEVPFPPCATDRLLGLALIEKSDKAAAVTVNATDVECVALEPVPVTVIVYDPGAVLGSTATVIVDAPPAVTDAGLKLTVTPAGCPDALSATDCADPLVTAVLIVELSFAPCATDRLVGLALIEKSDAAAVVTVSATVVECVALDPVPVTVIAYDPGAALESAATVIVDEPPAVTDAGLKFADAPAGNPLALRLTDCAEPLVTAVLIVVAPLKPCTTLTLLGLAPIEKSFTTGAVTVSVTEVVCVALAPVPVTVIE